MLLKALSVMSGVKAVTMQDVWVTCLTGWPEEHD